MNFFTKSALATALLLPAASTASGNSIEQFRQVKAGERHLPAVSQHDAIPGGTSAKAPTSGVIKVAPTGNVIKLTQEGEGYITHWQEVTYVKYAGIATELVEGDNGYVYLKNPLHGFTTDSYIKGQRVGDQYIFDLPQNIFEASYEYGLPYDWHLSLLQYSEENNTYYTVNSEEAKNSGLPAMDNKLVIDINEDGSLSYTGGENRSVIYGMISSTKQKWQDYGEINCKWTPFDDETVTPPAGLSTEKMAIVYDGHRGHHINVGYDNDDVYIQGIFNASFPEAWIKGHKSGSTIAIPTNQYLGYYDYDNSHAYSTTVSFQTKIDPETNEEYNEYAKTDQLVFTIDEATGTLSAPGQAFLCTPGKGTTYYYGMHDPVIKPISANISPNPAKPYDVIYSYPGQDIFTDHPYIEFSLANLNEDGDILDSQNLVYSVYIDDEQFSFKKDTYVKLDWNKRYIPYDFTDNYDFLMSGERRRIYFYFTDDNNSYGVRLFNLDASGNIIGQSEIAYATKRSGIPAVAEQNNILESVKYIDLCGREVSEPANGVFIKVETYTDGSVKTLKVVK